MIMDNFWIFTVRVTKGIMWVFCFKNVLLDEPDVPVFLLEDFNDVFYNGQDTHREGYGYFSREST